MEDVKEIEDIKKDLLDTMEKSHLVTRNEANTKLLKGVWQSALRLVAPLM